MVYDKEAQRELAQQKIEKIAYDGTIFESIKDELKKDKKMDLYKRAISTLHQDIPENVKESTAAERRFRDIAAERVSIYLDEIKKVNKHSAGVANIFFSDLLSRTKVKCNNDDFDIDAPAYLSNLDDLISTVREAHNIYFEKFEDQIRKEMGKTVEKKVEVKPAEETPVEIPSYEEIKKTFNVSFSLERPEYMGIAKQVAEGLELKYKIDEKGLIRKTPKGIKLEGSKETLDTFADYFQKGVYDYEEITKRFQTGKDAGASHDLEYEENTKNEGMETITLNETDEKKQNIPYNNKGRDVTEGNNFISYIVGKKRLKKITDYSNRFTKRLLGK